MPAVYAHRRFGAHVLAACRSGEARIAIESWPDLYNIGLQGPDILFYYDPLRKNPYKAAGDAMHDAPAAPFFASAAGRVSARPEGQALLSYLLGFVCHFALDSQCHSYIEYEIARSGHSHVSIETALDGALMEADGVDWRRANPAGYIAVNEVTSRTIAHVLPAGRAQVRACLGNMRRVNRLLIPGNPLDRPAYAASCEELGRLFDGAVPVALGLIENYCAHIFHGEALSDRFGRSYGPCEELLAACRAADAPHA